MSEHGAWRDGKRLVVRRGAPLPKRCPYCNAPAGPESMLKLRYALPGSSLRFLLPMPLDVLMKPFFEDELSLRGAVCETDSRPSTGSALGAVAFLGGLLLLQMRGNSPLWWALMAAGLVIAFLARRPRLRVVAVSPRYVTLTGAGEAFLATLPAWPGEANAGVERRFS